MSNVKIPLHFTRLGETFPRALEEATDEELTALINRYGQIVTDALALIRATAKKESK
jgi:hypothetical protein